jgi:hypothetical protein
MRFKKSLTSSASVSAIEDMVMTSNCHKLQAQHIITRRQHRQRDRWRQTTKELAYATDKRSRAALSSVALSLSTFCSGPSSDLVTGPHLCTYAQSRGVLDLPINSPPAATIAAPSACQIFFHSRLY